MSGCGKWDGLVPDTVYFVDLGREAVFFVPEHKLQQVLGGEVPEGFIPHEHVEVSVRRHLLREYGAFTTNSDPHFGIWMDGKGSPVQDANIEYRVAFIGKQKIGPLLTWLGTLCRVINEDCLYFRAGQYSGLLYPR